MTNISYWAILVGIMLLSMVVIDSMLRRLPITTAMIYLIVGYILGPAGVGILALTPIDNAGWLTQIAEVAVLISLFATGLNLGVPWRSKKWILPVRLALPSMILTIGMIAVVCITMLGLSLGQGILLAAILAPTDPVLASGIAPDGSNSPEVKRFGLSGEGALNDGTAFPFVLLGLGLLENTKSISFAHWMAVDLLWSPLAGLLIGFIVGTGISKLMQILQARLYRGLGLDQFLVLGLIAIGYGLATLCSASGFLAVFATGCAWQRGREDMFSAKPETEEVAYLLKDTRGKTVSPKSSGENPHPTRAVREFNGHLEKLAELAMVVLVGAMAFYAKFPMQLTWFIPLLFFVLRPCAVWLGTVRAGLSRTQRVMMGWFGIRGIGSVFYLAFSLQHGVSGEFANMLISFTLWTIVASIFLHGVTVLPIMKRGRRATDRGVTPRHSPRVAP